MDIEITWLTVAAGFAAVLLAPTVAALVDAWCGHLRRQTVFRSIAVASSAVLCWFVVWLLTRPELDARLVIPIAGLAALASVLTTVPFGERKVASVAMIAAVWTASVFCPAAIALFSLTDGLLGSGLRTLDLGGACAVLVPAGCALGALLVVHRRRPSESLAPNAPRVVAIFAVVWILWVLWLVGSELVIDGVTPRIVLNAVIAPITSIVGWLVVQRIRRVRTTAPGAVGGLFCGLVAVTAGCGYLEPLGASLTGLIAGVTCSAIGHGLVRRTGRAAWLLAVVLAVGGSTGVILLGAFATRSGAIFTGQPEVLFSQSASVALVIVYSSAVSFAIWAVVLLIDTRKRRTAARRPT